MVKISELEARKGFDEVVATVVSVAEPRDVRGGELTVCDAQIKDDSGSVKLTLWNDEVGKVKAGDSVKVIKGWANEYQGELSISAGKFGQLEVTPGSGEAPAEEKSEEVPEDVKMAIDEDII